jgi:hypothetical protein
MSPIYEIRPMIFQTFGNNVVIRMICKWGTCTWAIRRFRLQIVNAEIPHHVLIEDLDALSKWAKIARL